MCNCCDKARDFAAYPQFNPACLHCGARIIQHLGKLNIGQSECTRRRRESLADWLAYGHNESEIRKLAKGALCVAPAEPVIQKRR